MRTQAEHTENANFDAALYWAGKPIKKYVCTVKDECGETQTVICGSSTSDRATEIAIQNSYLTGSLVCTEVRLATPEDLGATTILQPTIKEKLHQFAKGNNLQELNITDGHVLIGNAPAIAYVNTIKAQHVRLTAALTDCLAIMAQCQQNHDYPKTFDSPIGTLAWDATVATARLLLQEGNANA